MTCELRIVLKRTKEVELSKRKNFHKRSWCSLDVCSKGIFPLVIFEDGTLDHTAYIKEVPPVTLQYGNKVIGPFSKMKSQHISID